MTQGHGKTEAGEQPLPSEGPWSGRQALPPRLETSCDLRPPLRLCWKPALHTCWPQTARHCPDQVPAPHARPPLTHRHRHMVNGPSCAEVKPSNSHSTRGVYACVYDNTAVHKKAWPRPATVIGRADVQSVEWQVHNTKLSEMSMSLRTRLCSHTYIHTYQHTPCPYPRSGVL